MKSQWNPTKPKGFSSFSDTENIFSARCYVSAWKRPARATFYWSWMDRWLRCCTPNGFAVWRMSSRRTSEVKEVKPDGWGVTPSHPLKNRIFSEIHHPSPSSYFLVPPWLYFNQWSFSRFFNPFLGPLPVDLGDIDLG